ncbi:MAG: peptidylprolyl isomerase [Armatimonadota bacterium]|nr:peptidylprolyl isomerase [Armatimonadota bacterium]MDW8156350.1 peptidylprolyl isomerase [Armatimonadota bacterium]
MDRRWRVLMAAAAVVAVAVGVVVAVRWARRAPVVAATVNGEPIYTAEVDRYVRDIGARFGVDFSKGEAARQRAQVARSVLDQLIERTLILQEARRTGKLASDLEVEERLRQIAQAFPSTQEFERALQQQGISRAELRERVRFELTVRRLLGEVKVPAVSEQEARSYFEAHRAGFDEPERVRVRHILLRTEAEARVVVARLRAGEPFDRLARELSQDPGSRDRGGDLGLVAPGQTVPEFERAAFSLRPGQTSDPVQTSFGYHVIQVTERLPAKKATWDTARAQVVELLRENKRREAFEAWVKDLRKRAKVVVHL